MSLTRKVAFNTVVQIAGKVITTVISLFLVAALTRYLGVAGFGQYTTIMAYLAFFSVLADFGFFWLLIREIAVPGADINKITSNIFTFRSVLGVGVYLVAFLISYLIPQYADFRIGIAIAAIASFFLTLNSTYVGVFQNKLHMEKAAISDVVGRALILILTLYFIKIDLGLAAVLWAYALGNIVNFALSFYFGRAYVSFKPSFDFPYWKKIFLDALPMGVVLILGLIYFRIDTLMLSLMRSSVDVGIYGPPYKILEIMLFVPSIFMGNVFPIITRYIYSDQLKAKSAIQKSFDFLVLISVPIVVATIFLARPIIQIVAGNEYLTAQTVEPIAGIAATSVLALQILVVAVGLSFVSHLFGYLVISLKKQNQLVWPHIFFVVFNIGLNYLLIPYFSYIGAAFVTVLTEALVLYFSYKISKRNFEFKLNYRILFLVAVSSLIMGLIIYFGLQFTNFYLVIILAALAYLGSLWLLGGLNKEMILSIVKGEKA